MPKPTSLNGKLKPERLDADHPLFPSCDGERWRTRRASDSQRKVKRRFLEAYFRINLAYARLLALRKKRRSTACHALERPVLEAIEQAIVARENLEDRYASRGVIATPVYRDGFTIDVRFADAHTRGPERGANITSSASVRITIPLPAGLRAKLCKI